MKVRIISGMCIVLVTILPLAFFQTIISNIVIGIISMLCVYEFIHSTRSNQNLILTFSSLIYAFLVPFFGIYVNKSAASIIFGTYCFIYFIMFFIDYKNIKFEKLCTVFLFSIILPAAVSSFIYVKNNYSYNAVFYCILILIAASASDTFAYFGGKYFGKRKLAKEISPNKTIEGAIIGVLGCMLTFVIFSYFYTFLMKSYGYQIDINFINLVILSITTSIAGIFGDLTASIIKRKYKFKDFGNIIPGHGGILDRLDSIIFTGPFLILYINFFDILK